LDWLVEKLTERNSTFRWMKAHYLALVSLVAVAALLGVTRLSGPWLESFEAAAYVNRQTAAMRPIFRGNVQGLAQAPRYTIEATAVPTTGRVSGRMTIAYTNRTGVTLSDMAFRLYPNATSVYGGGSLSVTEVARAGTALETTLSQSDTVLEVPLDPALAPGGVVALDLTFTAQVPYGSSRGYGIYDRAAGVLSLAGWYPVLARYEGGWQTPPVIPVGDAMVSEIGLYEVALTVPAGYQVASTGVQVGQESEGGQTTVHLVSGPAWEFAAAIGDQFEVHTAQVGDVTIRFFALPFASPVTTAAETLDAISRALTIYGDLFGPYRFNELDVVDVAVGIGGYEFPGMSYVEAGKRAHASAGAYEYLMVHEVAHQWWYGLVGERPVEEPWLDEAFANYAIALYRERVYGEAARVSLVAYWKGTSTSLPVDSPTTSFGGWSSYRRTVYERGAVFLDSLRREMGDRAFFDLLRLYQERMRYRPGRTETFLATAEEVAGRDLTSFFAPWFDRVKAAVPLPVVGEIGWGSLTARERSPHPKPGRRWIWRSSLSGVEDAGVYNEEKIL
jgi:hypothetical protein